jgi:hypothetical protein
MPTESSVALACVVLLAGCGAEKSNTDASASAAKSAASASAAASSKPRDATASASAPATARAAPSASAIAAPMPDTTWVQECDDKLVKMKACMPDGEAEAKAFRGTVDRSELFYDDLRTLCALPPTLAKCEAKAPALPPKSPKCLALLDCCLHAAGSVPAVMEAVHQGLNHVGPGIRAHCFEIAGQGDETCEKFHDTLAKRFESLDPFPKSRLEESCK